jgi:hypothetical protein
LYSADVRILSGTTKDKVDTVKRFLEAGCGRDASGKIDPKLMEYTVASGLLLDTLVEAGIDVNARIGKKKQTALMFVASQLNPRDTLDRLEKLIGLGAKVNERDKWGWTALMHAMDTSLISSRWEKHKIEMIPKVADFLKSKGATLTWKDKVKLKVERARPTRVFARTMAHIFGGLPAFPARLSIYE